ncbi:MAG: hypothetical protein M0D55_19550 [Elusimicrobiota bacterium]|nr:MAG: hypothetical protein M0D55_19550 [Elusimicrobiota bacterium]
MGVAVALLVYNVPAWAARLEGLRRGCAEGDAAIAALCGLPVQSWIRRLRWSLVAGAVACLVAGAGSLPEGERLGAGLVFAGGLVLSRFGMAPLSQLGLAGAGAAVASFVGWAQ